MWRAIGLSVLALGLAACASKGEDYYHAKDVAVLTLPEGQDARQIKPLFPVLPLTTEPKAWPDKFEVPRPRPMEALPEVAQPSSPSASDRMTKPELAVDGNGYAVLSVQGEFNVVWDHLDQALRAAGVKIEDRDQGLSQYFLSLTDANGKKATYQLRVIRGQSAYSLTLQQDDDTLASQDMTRALFESIVARWPSDKS
jgi:uncharacterized lipoprotein